MSRSSSKTGSIVGLVVVVALAAYIHIAKPFGPGGEGTSATSLDAEAPDTLGVAPPATAVETSQDGAGLASPFDAIGAGDVTVRLLAYRDRAPFVGQTVVVANARGDRLERATGEDGRVRFAALRAGRDWTLSVQGTGFATVEMHGIAVTANGTTDLQDLLLGERAVLRGRVIDERGTPIAGAAVSAYVGGALDLSSGFIVALSESALSFPTPTEATRTDEAGLFQLETLTPGAAYELKTKRSGYAFSVQSGLVVTPEKASGRLTIVLHPAATLKGRVLDESGRGVANAVVIAIEDAGMGGGFGRGGGISVKKDFVRSGADGTYVLDTLAREQAYRFGVAATGRAPLFDAQPVTMDVDRTRDFTLASGGTLTGTVTDAGSGAPIAGARVFALTGDVRRMGPGGGTRGAGGGFGRPRNAGAPGTPEPTDDASASAQGALTASDGTFTIEGLRPGTIAVGQVRAAGFADAAAIAFMGGTGWGEIRVGETTTVDVKLEPGASVTGHVLSTGRDGARVPVAGAQVAVMTFTSMMTGYPTAVSGEDGSFRVDGVRPGAATILATAPRYVSADSTTEATTLTIPPDGGVVERDVLLSSAGGVEGVVTTSRGEPVPGARVRAAAARSAFGAPRGGGGGRNPMAGFLRMLMPDATGGTVLSDAEGRYRVETVPSDEKMVVVADSDEHVPTESEPFTVRAGESAKVNVVLLGGATIRGRVLDDRGAAVPGARVRFGHVDPDTQASVLQGFRADMLLDARSITSDAGGAFEVARVKSGRTLLKVERDGFVTSYRRDLVVEPDQVVQNLVVTLIRGETIAGVVKGDDGKPVAGAIVSVTKQTNPMRGFGGGGAPAAETTEDDGTVEPSMTDRSDEQGRFTVEGIPPGSAYTVLIWFAPGYRGYGQAQEPKAIVRGVATGARDVEFALPKQEPGTGGFQGFGGGGPPRPPPGTTIPPIPPGAGMTTVPGMGG